MIKQVTFRVNPKQTTLKITQITQVVLIFIIYK